MSRKFILCFILTVVPLNVIAAQLLDIKVAEIDNSLNITLDFDKRPQHDILILGSPPRLVIDLFSTTIADKRLPSNLRNAFIKSVRSSPRNRSDYRLVFDLVATIHQSAIKTVIESANRLVVAVRYPSWFSVKPRSPKYLDKKALRDALIMIDAGHGGKDPGATGATGVLEKDVVLATARYLYQMINREYGMRALMTRDGDHFVDLRQRLDTTRANQADIFISLHADAFPYASVHGASVYVLSDKGASNEAARILAKRENAAVIGGVNFEDKDDMLASILLDLSQTAAMSRANTLARYVLAGFGNNVRSRRVESAGFLVLKSPDVPSVLVELGYLTNKEEEKWLRQATYQRKLAAQILKGIKRYLADYATSDMFLAHTIIEDYIVIKGDTLSKIARQFKTDVQRIKQHSGIRSDLIHVGQKLKVPVGK